MDLPAGSPGCRGHSLGTGAQHRHTELGRRNQGLDRAGQAGEMGYKPSPNPWTALLIPVFCPRNAFSQGLQVPGCVKAAGEAEPQPELRLCLQPVDHDFSLSVSLITPLGWGTTLGVTKLSDPRPLNPALSQGSPSPKMPDIGMQTPPRALPSPPTPQTSARSTFAVPRAIKPSHRFPEKTHQGGKRAFSPHSVKVSDTGSGSRRRFGLEELREAKSTIYRRRL